MRSDRLRRWALATLLVGVAAPARGQSPIVLPASFDAQGFQQFLILVVVNGERWSCSLDSGGSWVFAVDPARVAAAGLKPNSSGTSAGAGPDITRDERVTGVTAAIGALQLPGLTLLLRPKPDVAPDMECVFGLGILQDHVVQFDYQKPELRIFTRESFQAPARATAVPFEIDRFRNPFITTTVRLKDDDKVTARMLLDTGASYYSVIFAEAFARPNGIRARLRSVVPRSSHTPGLGLSATRVDELIIGSFTQPSPLAALIDTPSAGMIHDGLIGAGFFKHFIVTFDYHRRQMWLEPAAAMPNRPPFDGSGLDFTHGAGGRYRVHEVRPDTPAAAADVRVGDVMIAIDETNARQLTIGQIKLLLAQPGATRRLRLERNGTEHTITLTLKELL